MTSAQGETRFRVCLVFSEPRLDQCHEGGIMLRSAADHILPEVPGDLLIGRGKA